MILSVATTPPLIFGEMSSVFEIGMRGLSRSDYKGLLTGSNGLGVAPTALSKFTQANSPKRKGKTRIQEIAMQPR